MTWQLDPADESHSPTVSTQVRWWRSLRVTIAASTTILTAILVTSSGLVLARITLDAAEAQLRAQAVTALNASVATFAFGGAPPSGAILDADLLPDRLRRDVQTLDRPATYDDGTGMWAAQPVAPVGILAVRLDDTPLQDQTNLIIRTVLITLTAATIIAGTISWLLADRITARLRTAASSVNRVISGEPPLTTRHKDEVGVLNDALARSAAALTDRLRREQAFTADVAHDLRTPLTALVSAAELLDDNDSATLVRRQVSRMRMLVEDLLELARADLPDQTLSQPVELGTFVRDSLQRLGLALRPHLAIRDATTVPVQPARLHAVIQNLLLNAHQHGAGPALVTVHGRTITIHDHGPGFPNSLLTTGPARFQPGVTGGAGLGLAIVVEHCRALDARLTLTNHPNGGAVASVTLPQSSQPVSTHPAACSPPQC